MLRYSLQHHVIWQEEEQGLMMTNNELFIYDTTLTSLAKLIPVSTGFSSIMLHPWMNSTNIFLKVITVQYKNDFVKQFCFFGNSKKLEVHIRVYIERVNLNILIGQTVFWF